MTRTMGKAWTFRKARTRSKARTMRIARTACNAKALGRRAARAIATNGSLSLALSSVLCSSRTSRVLSASIRSLRGNHLVVTAIMWRFSWRAGPSGMCLCKVCNLRWIQADCDVCFCLAFGSRFNRECLRKRELTQNCQSFLHFDVEV